MGRVVRGTSRFPSAAKRYPGSLHKGCGNVPRHKYLLPTLHVQSQILQHQLEARAVPHRIVPELYHPTCGPAFWSTVALQHPGGLAGDNWVFLFSGGGDRIQALHYYSAPPLSRHLNPHPPWCLRERPGTMWFRESLHPLTFVHKRNTGPHTCQASMLPLGHTPQPFPLISPPQVFLQNLAVLSLL